MVGTKILGIIPDQSTEILMNLCSALFGRIPMITIEFEVNDE
jgi:hypothetical protein